MAVLVLLDLSAAFDTVDHALVISRLSTEFGLQDVPLRWFSFYLQNRRQCVMIHEDKSEAATLSCGVPQGSVLGPVLFVLYTNCLANVIDAFRINHYAYADDNTLMDSFKKLKINEALHRVSQCSTAIKTWMNENKLKLNEEKTEAMLVGTKARILAENSKSLDICGSEIQFSSNVKNLGVYLDPCLTMENQVNNICRYSYFHLRGIGNIRHLITTEAAKILVQSLVHSRIDYCNSLIYGRNQSRLTKQDTESSKYGRSYCYQDSKALPYNSCSKRATLASNYCPKSVLNHMLHIPMSTGYSPKIFDRTHRVLQTAKISTI